MPANGPGEAAEGSEEGEHSAEAAPCRLLARRGDPSEGCLGKLLSPTKRRQAVEHVRDTLGRDMATKRRACRVLGQARNTERCEARIADDEP